MIVSASRPPHIPEEDPIHLLDEEAFKREICKYNGIPDEIINHKEFLDFFLPMLRADFKMDETWYTKELVKLSCSITALGGIYDQEADQEDINGWKEYTDREFNCFMYEGGHFFIKDREVEVIKTIKELIEGTIRERRGQDQTTDFYTG